MVICFRIKPSFSFINMVNYGYMLTYADVIFIASIQYMIVICSRIQPYLSLLQQSELWLYTFVCNRPFPCINKVNYDYMLERYQYDQIYSSMYNCKLILLLVSLFSINNCIILYFANICCLYCLSSTYNNVAYYCRYNIVYTRELSHQKIWLGLTNTDAVLYLFNKCDFKAVSYNLCLNQLSLRFFSVYLKSIEF